MGITIHVDIDIEGLIGFFSVQKTVTSKELKSARNTLIKKYHTDNGVEPSKAISQEINTNYDKLKDIVDSPMRIMYGLSPEPSDKSVSILEKITSKDLMFQKKEICPKCDGHRSTKRYFEKSVCPKCECFKCHGAGYVRCHGFFGFSRYCAKCGGTGSHNKANCKHCDNTRIDPESNGYNLIPCHHCDENGWVELEHSNPFFLENTIC